MRFIMNCLGIICVIVFMYLLSWDKKNIDWKMIIKALFFQFIIAFLLIKLPIGSTIVSYISDFIISIIQCGQSGLDFVFGSLADPSMPTGFIFIIQTLGNIIYISALVSLLYHIGILGKMVKIIGKTIGTIIGTSEVESFVAGANMFLGQTESPVLVSKYLPSLSDSEILVILISGMGSMSVTILGGYHALGIPMEYLLIASAMVPIGSILISKILLPQNEPVIKINDISTKADHKKTIFDAIFDGASDGMQIVLSIASSLIGIIGIVSLINLILGFVGINLQNVFSYVFAPFGFLMGLDYKYILMEGELLGNKLIMNEFIAFEQLGSIISSLDYRTALILSISLSGFANLSSIGICLSGIAVLCPDKKDVLSRLIFKAMIGGVFVSILSAMIAGIVCLF